MADQHAELPGEHQRLAVLVADLVESVRLMQESERHAIARWRGFVDEVMRHVLPRHQGRLVKSLGDGLLVVLPDASLACRCAGEMHAAISRRNAGMDPRQQMALRVGIHVADVVLDGLDVYGAGVNLAARLASLGRPGDVVMSSEARDGLIPRRDPEVEDLGNCYLKHFAEAVRAWRITAGPTGHLAYPAGAALPLPSLAVIPLVEDDREARPSPYTMGVADELSACLARFSTILVISRPSIAVAIEQRLRPSEGFALLDVSWIAEVRCRPSGAALQVMVALREATGATSLELATVLPVSRGADQSADLEGLARSIVNVLAQEVAAAEAHRPLPNVESHALLLAAIYRMHRMARDESDRAKLALDELAARHPRAPEPHAWSAKWHMLRVAQGWATDSSEEAARASFHVQRALDAHPDHPLALAIHGQTQVYEYGRLDIADEVIRKAVARGPNEPLAWMFLSNLQAHQGRGREAMAASDRALALSPLDPTRFLLEMFAAQAALCAGEPECAGRLAAASLRHNGMHLPTYPAFIIAHVLSGDVASAREVAGRYLRLSPEASASRYASRFRGPQNQGRLFAEALISAGVPL
ncbi:MAG: adenylate/guanylate cyclase domain-containing protein [Pseudomonadota bacterium]